VEQFIFLTELLTEALLPEELFLKNAPFDWFILDIVSASIVSVSPSLHSQIDKKCAGRLLNDHQTYSAMNLTFSWFDEIARLIRSDSSKQRFNVSKEHRLECITWECKRGEFGKLTAVLLLPLHSNNVEKKANFNSHESLCELTKRETEVLEALLEGKRTREIAIDFDLSPLTVEVHRKNILSKSGFDSISRLVSALLCLDK